MTFRGCDLGDLGSYSYLLYIRITKDTSSILVLDMLKIFWELELRAREVLLWAEKVTGRAGFVWLD
jgi:hypothetical protein